MYKFFWWLTWQRFLYLCLPVAAVTGGGGYGVVRAVDYFFADDTQRIAEEFAPDGSRRPASAGRVQAAPPLPPVQRAAVRPYRTAETSPDTPPDPRASDLPAQPGAVGGSIYGGESGDVQAGSASAASAGNDPPPGDPELMPSSSATTKPGKNEGNFVSGGVVAGLGALFGAKSSNDESSSGSTGATSSTGGTTTGGGTGTTTPVTPEVAQTLAITSGGSPTQTTGGGYKVSTTIGPRLSAVKSTTANGYQVKLGIQGQTAP